MSSLQEIKNFLLKLKYLKVLSEYKTLRNQLVERKRKRKMIVLLCVLILKYFSVHKVWKAMKIKKVMKKIKRQIIRFCMLKRTKLDFTCILILGLFEYYKWQKFWTIWCSFRNFQYFLLLVVWTVFYFSDIYFYAKVFKIRQYGIIFCKFNK